MSEAEKINFDRGVPDPDTLPIDKVAESCSNILEKDGRNILQYASSKGYAPLRKVLAERVGNGASKENILIGNGSLQLLNILAAVFLDEGDTVLVESPTYDRAITAFSRLGVTVEGVPLQKDGINIATFQELVEKKQPELFYIIPDFQNPTGITTSLKKRRKIVEIAEENGVTIIENTLYRSLRYSGENKPPLWELNKELVLHISSFSKKLSPGLRVGWLAASDNVMDEIAKHAEDTYITPNLLSQGIIYQLIEEGWIESNIEHLKKLYKARLDTAIESLQQYLPNVKWFKPQGGFFLGLWFPEGTDLDKLYEKSKEKKVMLSKGGGFFPDKQSHNFLRIPFCAVNQEEIEEGIKIISTIYESLRNE